jgi:AraC-like DNA-binding protein
MWVYIKNMVCERCKMMVKAEFEKLGLSPIRVNLGEVEINKNELSEQEIDSLDTVLKKLGFELLTNKKKQQVAQVKNLIIELVHYNDQRLNINLSDYLSEKLDIHYASLSAIFSEMEQDTIEQFFIRQKIEKAKELLTYGERSLSEIAYLLNYSSIAHLSAQFKKITNQTATQYKKSNLKRVTLDRV